jgi:hypothetical protein
LPNEAAGKWDLLKFVETIPGERLSALSGKADVPICRDEWQVDGIRGPDGVRDES